MKFLILFFALVASAQTRVAVSQVPWNQTDDSFFRQCIFNADGSYAHAYAYFANPGHALTSSAKIPSTYLRYSQISNYGVAVSQDQTFILIKNWDLSWKITTNVLMARTLEVRFGMWTPNINLIGDPTTAYSNISFNSGGWAMSLNGTFMVQPLVTVTMMNGLFAIVPSTTIFHNTCELWNSGIFLDIPPNP
jgi:hypothetical protein